MNLTKSLGWPLAAVAGLSGAALLVRALVPAYAGHSPLALEGACAVALLLLAVVRSTAGEPAPAARKPAWPELAGVLALVVLALYGSWNLYFVGDDYFVVWDALLGRGHDFFASLVRRTDEIYYRPVGYTALWLFGFIGGKSPLAWHLINLALHLLNCALVWRLAAQLGLGAWTAAFAAALFGVHASRPESVVWITGNFELVSTLFFLASLVAFTASAGSRRRRAYWASLGLALLALWTKEGAYVLPAVLLLLPRGPQEGWTARLRAVAPFFALAALAFAHRWLVLGGPGGYIDPATGRSEAGSIQLLRVGKLVGSRLWAVLMFPINWEAKPALALAVTLAVMIVVAALVLLFGSRPRRSLVLFGAAAAVLCALPAASQLLIGADLQKSRLLYLPSLGLVLLLAAGLDSLADRRLQLALAGALLLFQISALRHNLTVWQQVAELSRTSCESARALAHSPSRRVLTVGAPGSIRGVYFYMNGLAACLGLGDGEYWRTESRPDGAAAAAGYAGDVLQWNPASGRFEAPGPAGR